MKARTMVYLDGLIAGIIGAAVMPFGSYSWTQSVAYLFTRLLSWEPRSSWGQKILPRLREYSFL